MISIGQRRYLVKLNFYQIGKDKLVIITGGMEHIGSATLIEGNRYIS